MPKSADQSAAGVLAKPSSSGSARPQLLYFGLLTLYSALPLAALLEAGEQVAAVIIPGSREDGAQEALTPAQPDPDRSATGKMAAIDVLASECDIPLFALNEPAAAAAVRQLAAFQPDAAIVAGFPLRIPPALLAVPGHGFLNAHPSLLPAYRGPTPLFWALRAGETVTGVTLHCMDEDFDTGDIVFQEPVTLVEGATGREHTRHLAEVAASLVCRAARTLREDRELPRRPQPPGGHYQSFPAKESFHLSTDWPAQRAFNFMRGTAGWNQPYTLEIGGLLQLTAREALHYEPEGELGAPLLHRGSELLVQFNPGVLHARA